ncbi:MAG: hypothetical protein H5U26_07525 [Immundisolibacter sp.]|uniref:hypothetical protein n=1 Tax=Immundisolibacter sp. TaxID=1934948 RepID=UPI0019C2F62E|nr:hypothetical protein [Immundisolibacter sp.]MBC7161940.1 hypothetical protein [Immundisolibacter sp.]
MTDRSDILRYFIDEYFEGDAKKASEATGYSVAQFKAWISRQRLPRKSTIEYLVHCVFTPEFRVIVEFGEFNQSEPILTQLRRLLKGHEERPGIYAFYDSMANLVYIGKATKLLRECDNAIRREVHVRFPNDVKNKPENRAEVVRYISAYDVGKSNWVDYPKHVESLILRISKPVLNKNIGQLEKAYVIPEDG